MASFTVDAGAVIYDGRLLYTRTAAYDVEDTYANYLKSLDDVAASLITITVAFTATSPPNTDNYFADLGGLQFTGTCNADMVASTTDIYDTNLAGYTNDYFNGCYYLQVTKNTNNVGVAPEKQIRKITDYVSATGKFICDAFTANVEAGDSIKIFHESIIAIGRNDADNVLDSSTVAANEDGSILERLEQIQEAVNKGTGTALAANKSLVDALGTTGSAVADSAVSVLGAIGANNANNAFDSSTVVSNADGSVLERLEALNNYVKGSCLNKDANNYLAVTADMTVADWNTVASHTVFTVTGMVRMRIIPECVASLTAGAGATIGLGVVGATGGFIADTDFELIDIGEVWDTAVDGTITKYGDFTAMILDKVVSGGLDVGYEVKVNALTGGSIVFHCWWEPLNATGAVVAGTGAVLA